MRKDRLKIVILLQLLFVAVFVTPVFAEDFIELEVGYDALEEYMSYPLEEGYSYEVSDEEIAFIEDGVIYAKDFGDCILYQKDDQGQVKEIEVIVYWVGDEPIPWGSVAITRPYAKGYPDQTFKSMNFITRAEIATMFSNLLALETHETRELIDLSSDHWAYTYVQNVLSENLMTPRLVDEFYPDAYLTRAEMAKIISTYANRMGFYLNEEVKYMVADVPFNHPCFKEIHQVMNYRLLSLEDDTFNPEGFISRGEAVSIINTLVGRETLEYQIDFTDINLDDIYYDSIISACHGTE